MIQYLSDLIKNSLGDKIVKLGLSDIIIETLVRCGLIMLVLLTCWIIYQITQGPLLRSFEKFTRFTNHQWDNVLLEKHFFRRLLYFIPLIILYIFNPPILEGTVAQQFSLILLNILLLITGMLAFDALLNSILVIYESSNIAKDISITPFVQVIKLLLYFVTAILIISILVQKTPFYILSGLGALTAVMLFVFKDILMGFVGGIQLIANKMVAPGDWIEMPKYGADGDVLEITLTTVKVKNFDNTITTIPTYALINESFKNWRNMNLSGGRRIKRFVYIDLGSIKFCNSEMLERFKKFQLISNTINNRQQEIFDYNKHNNVDESTLVNGRRLTNIGIFRSYVEADVRQHPKIHQEMTFIVRQLSPGEKGLPIEIYVFCKETNWTSYESVQADIFDHILAVVSEFDLQVFQEPSGTDFKMLSM